MHGRHTRTDHGWLPAMGLVVLIVLMSAAAGTVGWLVARDSDAAPATRSLVATATGTSTATPTSSVVGDQTEQAPATLAQCRSLWASQVSDQLAADTALDQWRLHIDAMNQLTAGEITLEQAAAFWKRSRLGALRQVDHFRSVDNALQASGRRCSGAPDAGLGAAPHKQLAACQAATEARAAALALARTAITTWEHHIMDMERLRAGEITPAQATAMWLQSWRAGARQLHDYDRRATTAQRHTC